MKRVFVPGVFDVFHVGHLNYLKRASEAGDYLIVGVQDDRAVFECKGVRPVIPLAERMAILEELRFVDEVVSYVDVFQGPLLEGLEIDVLAVGEEYGEDVRYPIQKKTLKYCEQNGIEVVRAPRTNHVSSTNIRTRLKEFWNARANREDALPAGVTVLGSFQDDQQKTDMETSKEVELILQGVAEPSNKTLLDLGCGDGRQLVHLGGRFKQLVGVDFAKGLLDIARRRFDAIGADVTLVEEDVTKYCPDEKFDVFLLSGITPYVDDAMLAKLLANIDRMSKPDSVLLVRTSIAVFERIDVVNQFSRELGCRYSAYYRTAEEIRTAFREHGWKAERSEELYQHREDTAVWWFEFAPTAAATAKTVDRWDYLDPPRPKVGDTPAPPSRAVRERARLPTPAALSPYAVKEFFRHRTDDVSRSRSRQTLETLLEFQILANSATEVPSASSGIAPGISGRSAAADRLACWSSGIGLLAKANGLPAG